ncbi:primosomal protein N' [Pontimicrobium sp. IMCC45349]|uniref:replication restart helicase PriA n=1 Tax=Pontimicrobium sp. IMCC45349 TaxID=3391574 RepID=UPI0039A00478
MQLIKDSYFIDVILPIPLERTFTYSITEAEFDFLKPGIRVAVPFGKSKIYTALVFNIHQEAPQVYEAKPIHQILDEKPIVNTCQLKLWQWIANYYMCTLGDVLRAALPSAFLLESESIISLDTNHQIEDTSLKDDEFLVFEALHHQSSLKVQDVSNILDKKNILPVLKRLIDKKAITVEEEIFEKYKPKLIRYVKLHETFENDEKALQELLDKLSRAPKQRQIIMSFFSMSTSSKKPIKVSELIEKSQATSTQVKILIDKHIFEEYYLQTDRVVYSNDGKLTSKQLNKYQETAFNEVKESFKNQNVALIHGVTSSGKTEIYVKLIEEVLAQGKQTLYLVPEIALTSQLVNRLKQYFGNQIAVYHSKYSLNERVEVWNNVLNNSTKAKVVLGARSSVLLPFNDLGLIIVDEEHEQSYKQFDPAPRYHARDTAIVLANLFKAKTLLGSATPSVETYFNATVENKYGFIELTRRYNDVLMPEIELVDIKDKHKRKRMKGHFSDRLIEEMTDAFKNNLQVILFQNRRGYSPIVECNTCGHSPQCPNCDVTLTYHQYRSQLRCHYCGHNIAMQNKCQACGSVELDSKGFGTEQIEAEVKQLFPDVKVARMDLDTTRGKHAYSKIITAFENQEVDVLVGTQMLTKGLDFRNVKLVGIMNADNMLNFPDFRAHERSYQLMQQVSGRAGRTDERGKVLIQTYNPYHKILQQVSTNDYRGMFNEQMDERYNYKYPPIYRIIKITLKHRDYNKVNDGAEWLSKSLRQLFRQNVLGPEFPPVSRIRNQYHKNILIKIPQKQSLGKTKEAILKVKNSFSSIKDFRPIRVILNVDNY